MLKKFTKQPVFVRKIAKKTPLLEPSDGIPNRIDKAIACIQRTKNVY